MHDSKARTATPPVDAVFGPNSPLGNDAYGITTRGVKVRLYGFTVKEERNELSRRMVRLVVS